MTDATAAGPTLVKICGITNVEDALEAARLGASFLGFVFAESPRRADPQTVRAINRILGGDVRTVGVFTDESDEILRTMDECRLDYAQLHGGQSDEFAARIGGDRVIRAVRVRNEQSIEMLAEFGSVRFYLLDTFREGLAGGTGETFDWSLAARARDLGKPIVLSGGLNPANVGEAIRALRPFAVDAASGVEASPGRKDHHKLKEFIANVREADRAA